MSGLILQFAYNYTDEHRSKLSTFDEVKELETYLKKQNTLEEFVSFADKNGLKRRNLMIQSRVSCWNGLSIVVLSIISSMIRRGQSI